jgi:CRP-like cAMP-binding protein/uncharacterized protein (DUF2249 family)
MADTKRALSRIDVRSLPLSERHAPILTALDALPADGVLTIVTDHEARPLRLKIEALYPDQVVFGQRQFGMGHWEITLRRPVPEPGTSDLGAFLRRCAVLTDAHDRTLGALERHGRTRAFAAGATIVEQDAQWAYLGLVRSGTLASVMSSRAGSDQKLFDILTGETFGIVETLDGGRTVARITVTSPACVVLLPRGIVLSAMADDIGFARSLNTICAQRTRRLAERYNDRHGRTALARVAAAILPYAAPDVGLIASLEPLRRMTQTQLALSAGTAKEVAARAIAELEAAGAIERARGRIARIDRRKLGAFVDGR